MNESSTNSLESILMNDFSIIQSNKKCSIKRMICSCFKKQKNKTKTYYITKWRKYLTKENTNKSSLNDPFTILINLWAHKTNIIKELESVRINPNLITPSNIILRNDLEFYIPQLCSFILFGEIELVEESLSFLCKASYSSFFFAHRVIWFLKSMLTPENNVANFNTKIRNILHVIQTIYKSDDIYDKKEIKRYHIAGSDQYMNYVNKKYLNDQSDGKLIDITVFKRYDYCTNSEEEMISNSLYSFKQIDNEDVNLTSFLSNIHFYDYICGVCDRIRYIESHSEREKELAIELNKMNKELPYNVYIPFCNEKIRNYLIGEFSIKDCKVFKTKERAPILFTAICFRIEEMTFDKDKNTFLENNKSFEMEKIGLYSKGDSQIKKQYNKISYLMTVDISLSKPIFVGQNIRKGLKEEKEEDKENKEIKELKREENYKKIELAIKETQIYSKEERENEKHILNNNHNDSSITSSNKNKQNLNEEEFIINTDKKPPDNIHNNNNHTDGLGVKVKIDQEPKQGRSRSSSFSSTISSSSSSSDAESEVGAQPSQQSITKKSNNELSSIFGESLEALSSRLKMKSPYGSLASFKISKFIIKSGEDFLQEQFTSQLISEFSQIFKIEKVECYLYPYEIISTGYNAGIIEVVPNAISLDELKHKISDKNLSLADFYSIYFGGPNSQKYKKAIKNLIASLAGYCLVCYFLQLKDRHNANILVDTEGHFIHIDFGFVLSHAPGHEFESAPFKLTNEIIDIIGGVDSGNFKKFRKLMWKGMIAISKHYEKILVLVEMMYCGYGKNMECFENGEDTLKDLKERFKPKEKMKKKDYLKLVDNLIQSALQSWRTKWYDKYQYYFQGIFY